MKKSYFIKYKLCYVLICLLSISLSNSLRAIAIENTENKFLENKEDLKIDRDQYILGKGDVLYLKTLSVPELSSRLEILSDGTISLPIFGSTYIDGKTLDEASKLIKNLMSKELIKPEIHLTIVQKRPILVSVIGEVINPGVYTLQNPNSNNETTTESVQNQISPNVNQRYPNVIDAISEAGGFNQNANISEVILKRKLPGEKNEYKQTKLNLLDVVLNGDLLNNINLFDQDIILITKANGIPRNISKISSFNFSPKNIEVSVVGEVVSPGKINISPNASLYEAIYNAGGFEKTRGRKKVEILRSNGDGSVTVKKLRINLKEKFSSKNNPPLQNKDIILVRRNVLARSSDTLGNITKPLDPFISVFTLFKLLE